MVLKESSIELRLMPFKAKKSVQTKGRIDVFIVVYNFAMTMGRERSWQYAESQGKRDHYEL